MYFPVHTAQSRPLWSLFLLVSRIKPLSFIARILLLESASTRPFSIVLTYFRVQYDDNRPFWVMLDPWHLMYCTYHQCILFDQILLKPWCQGACDLLTFLNNLQGQLKPNPGWGEQRGGRISPVTCTCDQWPDLMLSMRISFYPRCCTNLNILLQIFSIWNISWFTIRFRQTLGGYL